ncbi:pisatin demethylase [Paecilomyces variotii No. 5]|uniref:Pisatin demethylase n=1 Tax=Byssochlamys spectabilis (strain No. 5 / NBRC 109023) TaxID=1356009 RepID=V5FV32_BYSSN|nr:pisatin demethylase [Paecilomyces variotii No. 5]
MVSVGDPEQIGNIYSFKKPWLKSDFYRALLLKTNTKPVEGIFATQNEAIHRQLKRPIANVYSMRNLLSFEPYVDKALKVFLEQIEKRFTSSSKDVTGTGDICDLSLWLQMLAFDVMGELTFSHRFGFMESGSDIDGAMNDLWKNSQKTALVTQMPWLENIWTNNPIQRYLRGGGTSPGVIFAMKRIQERRAIDKGELKKEWTVNNRDMLSRFMEVETKESVPPYALMVWTGSNITAGSDSTAIFLRAFFYHLLHNANKMEKLLQELDNAAAAGKLADLAGYREVHELPYFNACFHETSRMHPALGLPMERIVPPEGTVLCKRFIPGGTVVGMSSWVTHHDMTTFGNDCDVWDPERWLCNPEKRKKMKNRC